MIELSFPYPYAMIFAGYNTLQYLETKEKIADMSQRIHGALVPGGVFLSMTYHRRKDKRMA
jgi:hypothetical protein